MKWIALVTVCSLLFMAFAPVISTFVKWARDYMRELWAEASAEEGDLSPFISDTEEDIFNEGQPPYEEKKDVAE